MAANPANDKNSTPTGARLRVNVIVSGDVQGVSYRAFVRKQATGLDITGHAENMANGRMEVVAEGNRDDLELLLVKMRMGPTLSVINDLDVSWAEASGLRGFHVY